MKSGKPSRAGQTSCKRRRTPFPASVRHAELAALVRLRDDQIDTTDIPEVSDWSRAAVGRFKTIAPDQAFQQLLSDARGEARRAGIKRSDAKKAIAKVRRGPRS